MKVVSIKFNENVLDKIDENIVVHNFNSRTEFIREAIRDKLENLNKKELLKEFLKQRGKSSKKTSYEENTKNKELISEEILKELEERFK